MSTHAPHDEPPLPTRAREDLSAFRSVKPSDALMARVQSALAAAEQKSPPSPGGGERETSEFRAPAVGGTVTSLAEFERRRRARWSGVGGMALIAAAAAGVFALRSPHAQQSAMANRPVEVSVRLGADGPAWVHLPARLHEHGGVATTVHVDVPAHQAENAQPALGEENLPRTCMGALCSHRAVASLEGGTAHAPLRVRIHQPGRYEIRVTHASHAHMQHDHFVVLATR